MPHVWGPLITDLAKVKVQVLTPTIELAIASRIYGASPLPPSLVADCIAYA